MSEEETVVKGYEDLWKFSANLEESLAAFEDALRRDPASPFRWEDLGGALLAAGRIDRATYCFRRALQLGPQVPTVQMRFANFALQTGRTREALGSMRGVLAQTAAFDEVIFGYYGRLGLNTAEILGYGIPETPRVVEAFFLRSLALNDKSETRVIWNWGDVRGLFHDNVADAYVRQMISDSLPQEAADLWAAHLGPMRNGYRETNFLYNGSFEYPLNQNRLDWKIGTESASRAIRDDTVAHSGQCSLRAWLTNGPRLLVSQEAVVQGGLYSLEAWARSSKTSANAGIRLRVSDETTGLEMAASVQSMPNRQEWTHSAAAFSIPSKTKLVKIALSAWDSSSADAGTIWIDDVTLRRLGR